MKKQKTLFKNSMKINRIQEKQKREKMKKYEQKRIFFNFQKKCLYQHNFSSKNIWFEKKLGPKIQLEKSLGQKYFIVQKCPDLTCLT